jgi:hypothetical protein
LRKILAASEPKLLLDGGSAGLRTDRRWAFAARVKYPPGGDLPRASTHEEEMDLREARATLFSVGGRATRTEVEKAGSAKKITGRRRRVPSRHRDVPYAVVGHMAQQLGVHPTLFTEYDLTRRTYDGFMCIGIGLLAAKLAAWSTGGETAARKIYRAVRVDCSNVV